MESHKICPFVSRWFIQVVACVRISFRFTGEQYSNCMDIPHFVHPFICWWALGLFPALAIVISAAMNTGVQVSVFNPFRYIHRCEIAECYGNAMLSFLKNCQTFSQWLHHFHSHQQWARVPISLHTHQYQVRLYGGPCCSKGEQKQATNSPVYSPPRAWWACSLTGWR